ncbi:hypothetical protein FVE85_7545 [Porphyridium purpureum]|uniref:Uncharacterized protein n=1 Tax=Porphyridium purpureum TaxID=35688 RepID=A0A5J4ZA05_PORPP|nr:hypothetical protein FVE85_7545 [Porphyridium purpureum]|eukprot:POR5961..scf295_1
MGEAGESGGISDTLCAMAFVGTGAVRPSRAGKAGVAVCAQKREKGLSKSAGFKNEFLPEIGTRGPGSRPFWDLRPSSERKAEERVCDMCRGTGTTFCGMCEGATMIQADGSELKCPACKGTNKAHCGSCRGTGKLAELTPGYENTLDSFLQK